MTVCLSSGKKKEVNRTLFENGHFCLLLVPQTVTSVFRIPCQLINKMEVVVSLIG